MDHIILAELSLPFFMPLNCNLCLGLPLACALRTALWGVTLIIESPCPGLQFDRMQTQDWHHDLALSICEDLCKTDHEALTVLPRFSRPPTWPGPSGFSLTYTYSQANHNKGPSVLDKVQMNTVQQKTHLSEDPEVQLKCEPIDF